MSTISGVSSSAQAYTLQAAQTHQRPAGPPPEIKQQFSTVAESFGLSSSDAASLMSEIDSVMQDAMQNGASRESVESSIGAILEERGIDAEEFKSKVDEAFANAGMRPPAPSFGTDSSDLLDTILGEDDDSASGSSSLAMSIAESLKNLPAGSFLNLSA